MTQAVSAATGTIPIVTSGLIPELVPSLAHPAGNITGITVIAGYEIYGKHLESSKKLSRRHARRVPGQAHWGRPTSAPRSAYEGERTTANLADRYLAQRETPSECQRGFAEIAQDRPDAIVVSGISELFAYRQLIVELVEKKPVAGNVSLA
jgi:putative tryptophan/tyrosine transport system substrate-binding protein